MTVWTVTGSRPPRGGYDVDEMLRCRRLLTLLWQRGDTLVTGGCVGIDALAMVHAAHSGLHVITLLPSKRQFTDLAAVRLYSDEVEDTGLGYWARDLAEVNRSDKVIALPLYERDRSTRLSGTWHTWDLGVEQCKASVLMVIRPRGAFELLGPDAERVERAVYGVAR